MNPSIEAKLKNHLPSGWNNIIPKDLYTETELSSFSSEYTALKRCISGCATRINRITKVECPHLYAWFLLKKAEYASKGIPVLVCELYHDTAAGNIPSILGTNLDWRMVSRHKFGQGVSFSPSTTYANKQSARANGTSRAMIVADVLIGRSTSGNCSITIPPSNYDTTTGNAGSVYVKFYDNEFYPKYVIYYDSIEHVYRRRRYLF